MLPFFVSGGNSDSVFEVEKAAGTIIIAKPLDAEQRSFYNLTVQATDGTNTAYTTVMHDINFINLSLIGGTHLEQQLQMLMIQMPQSKKMCPCNCFSGLVRAEDHGKKRSGNKKNIFSHFSNTILHQFSFRSVM